MGNAEHAMAWRTVGLYATLALGLGTWGLLASATGLANLGRWLGIGAALSAAAMVGAATVVVTASVRRVPEAPPHAEERAAA